MNEARYDYFADFNMYTQMAHYVGKLLHIRPNEILDTWGVAELIVAYGQYANEAANENYESWKAINMPTKDKKVPPRRYVVRFVSVKEMEDG